MPNIIQLRRDTASDWTAAATVLASGELGMETDTLMFKVGDGSTAWASLSYYTGSLTLDALDNVSITSNAAGEILKWTGSAWINQTLAEAGIQSPPSEGAFADGDKTKLDAQSGTNSGDESAASDSTAGVIELATTAETHGETSTAALTPTNVGAAVAQVTLTDAASITNDMATGINFEVTLAGNRDMANPTNPVVGRSGYINVVQDATGSRTLTWSSFWMFAAATEPTLTVTADAEDLFFYTVISATQIVVSGPVADWG
jgi:hypothetical protein